MAREKADFIQLRFSNDRHVIIYARGSWGRRLLCADTGMLAPFNELGRQICLAKAPLFGFRGGR